MKYLFLFLAVCTLVFSCTKRDPLAYTKGIKSQFLHYYEEETLLSFFDSISNIQIGTLRSEVGISEEKKFREIKNLNTSVSDSDMSELKKLFQKNENGMIDLEMLNESLLSQLIPIIFMVMK